MRKKLFVFAITTAGIFAQDSVPASLRVAESQNLLFQRHGIGAQIYTCKAADDKFAWMLKAPEAKLLDGEGEIWGKHFGGPTWEAKDGSRVVGKSRATVPSPDPRAIPWLLLDAVQHEGNGTMSLVVSIQRLNTKGGKAPAEGCDDARPGAETRVPYEADYLFYGKTK